MQVTVFYTQIFDLPITFNSCIFDTLEYNGVSRAISQAYGPDAVKSNLSSVTEVGDNVCSCEQKRKINLKNINLILKPSRYFHFCLRVLKNKLTYLMSFIV